LKSALALSKYPISLPLAADDIVELHAARLLLLLLHCGTKNRIDGLTKLAKLDFFVRYPSFFHRIAKQLGRSLSAHNEQVESMMVRHHYGPWDKRYYQVLAFLESRGLLAVEKHGNAFHFVLTALGDIKANVLSDQAPFELIVLQMKAVKKLLGRKIGTQLKNLVYTVFDTEIKQRKFGEFIQ